MGIFSVTAAAAAIALAAGAPAIDDPAPEAQCVFEPLTLTIDAAAGPLLVSANEGRRGSVPAVPQGQWGQAALRPYDVMSSLGVGSAPTLPAAMSFADAPPPLPMGSPLALGLAAAGLLGLLYLRRTQL